MNSMQPGWYPDPSGGPGQRYFDGYRWTEHANSPTAASGFATGTQSAPRRGLPNWGWAAVAVSLTLLVVAFVAFVVVPSGPPMPDSSPSSTPSGPPPRSALIPELQLPAGTTQRDYTSHELFDVSVPYADTVEALRPQLPIGRTYDGLAWCTEFTFGDEETAWSWGDESDYLSVSVEPASDDNGSQVTVAREPEPSGCRR